MDKLHTPGTIKKIREAHGFRMTKSLGQNFLADKNIIDKIIVGSLIGPEDLVIEIGPGLGVLTAAAASHAGRLIAIEIDSRLIPILAETLAEYDNIEIRNQDIMKTDLAGLIAAEPRYKNVRIIGNLPYYITTPIIMKVLEEKVPFSSMTIMLQKEVADRILAKPATKDYGALSVAVQYRCMVEVLAQVPREAFVPRPNVDSTVIRLDARPEPPVRLTDEGVFFAVVKAAFGQRRKMLLNALTAMGGIDKEASQAALAKAGIDPARRGETLSIPEFAALADAVRAGRRNT